MKPTQFGLILVNTTLNAYPGKRPKKIDKLYDVEKLFNYFKTKTFPLVSKSKSAQSLRSMKLDNVTVCLPGSRGCVVKARHGTELDNRQVARLNAGGLTENPKFSSTNRTKKYGFLKFTGTIQDIDGNSSNITIPIDASGVIGLRLGLSALSIDLKSDQSLNQMISELADMVFEITTVKQLRPFRIELINASFNMYTDKIKSNRPKLMNFSAFLKEFHQNLNGQYGLPTKPWIDHQGGPLVIKSTLKSISNLPTITVSPFGRVEVLGAKSIESTKKTYILINEAFSKVSETAKKTKIDGQLNAGQPRAPTLKGIRKTYSFPNSIRLKRTSTTITIDGKSCSLVAKPLLVALMTKYGMATKGTKKVLCDRLSSALRNQPSTSSGETVVKLNPSRPQLPSPEKASSPQINLNDWVPGDLRKQCLQAGISIYDRQTLKPKPLDKLRKQCTSSDKRILRWVNTEAQRLGVKPYANRARDLYMRPVPKLTISRAKELAKDPLMK